MTLPQYLSLGTLAGMMVLFIWGKFRYDVTAILALLASLALGIVTPKQAFTGFSDDIVIIVGSALVISAAVQRSGVIERALRIVSRRGAQHSGAAAGADRIGRRRLRAGQEHRRAGDADARRVPDGQEERLQPLGVPDADGRGVAAGRADDPGGHLAQHHRQPGARADDRRAVRHVRLYARRCDAAGDGAGVSVLRLAAHPSGPACRADDGRGAGHQGLCHRSGDRRGIARDRRNGGCLHRTARARDRDHPDPARRHAQRAPPRHGAARGRPADPGR